MIISYSSYERDYGCSDFKVSSIQDAVDLAASELSNLGENFEQEGLFVITMDEKLKVRTVRLLSLGTYNTIPISPQEICKQALRDNATNILILHNHPRSSSASLMPSEADIRVTDNLLRACSLLDIVLVDHLIVSSTYNRDHNYYSMRQGKVLDFQYYNKIENLDLATYEGNLKWR